MTPNRCRSLWGLAAVACMSLALAEDSPSPDPGTAARDLGRQGNDRVHEAGNTDPDSARFPWYQGTDVPERAYYDSGATIEEQGREANKTSVVGQSVETGAIRRPRFFFDPNTDPLFQRQQQANRAGTALTASYSGCESLAVDNRDGSYAAASCYANALDPMPTQQRDLTTHCPPEAECEAAGISAGELSSDMAWNYEHPNLLLGTIGNNYWKGSCATFDRTTTFTIDDVALLKEFRLTEVGFDDWIEVQVNGHTVHRGPHGGDMLEVVGGRVQYRSDGATGRCELSEEWRQSPNVDLRPYLHNGSNAIRMRVIVGGKGEGFMRFRIAQYCDCRENDRWVVTGSSGDVSRPSCRIQSSQCTAGVETRSIDGVPVTRDCWSMRDQYQCSDPSEMEEASCRSLRASGCEQTRSTCLAEDAQGRCTRYRQDFRCPGTAPSQSTTTLCGADLYCPNGTCVSDVPSRRDASGDFAQSAAALAAAQNASNDLDVSSMSMFKGEAKRCAETAFGFSDCCSDSGWGQDIGLASCDEEEKQLGIAREAGRAHYVGSHTSGSFVDERKYQTYCTFTSKLSRIVQEQGRVQLGIGWGSSKHPDCRPLSTSEVERLNWEGIDFGEFYADAEAAAQESMKNRESEEAIQRRLQEHAQRMNGPSEPVSGSAP